MVELIVILVCNFSLSRCSINPDYTRDYRDPTVCQTELKNKIGALKLSIPVPGEWRIVGWCGLPLSSLKAGA